MGNILSKRKYKETENHKELIICRKANRLFHNGNSILALRIMDDACRKNTNSGLLCRVYADICSQTAFATKDFKVKMQFFNKALDLCRKGVVLLPNSLEFSDFYVRLLFYNGFHEDAIQEGQRGLSISTPIDPTEEDWTDGKAEFEYPLSRIRNLRSSIKNFINESSSICRQVDDLISDENNLLHVFNKIIADATAEIEETSQRSLLEIEAPMDGAMRVSDIEQPPRTLGERILGLTEDCQRIILLKIGPVSIIEDCPFLDPVVNLGLEALLYGTLDLTNVTRTRTADELMRRGLGFIRELYLGNFIGTDSFFITNSAAFSSIRSLRLWCCKDLSERVLTDTLPHLTVLESFHTCNCKISEQIIYQLSQSSPKLSEFSIYCFGVTDSGLDNIWYDDDDYLHEYIDWMCTHLGGRHITKTALRGFEMCRSDVQSVLATFPSLVDFDLGRSLILRVGEDDVFNRIGEYLMRL